MPDSYGQQAFLPLPTSKLQIHLDLCQWKPSGGGGLGRKARRQDDSKKQGKYMHNEIDVYF